MILSIDLGTKLGWFLGDVVGPARWGTFPCAGGSDLGKRLRSTDEFWRAMLPLCTGIAIEKPNTAGDSNYFPIRSNMAMLGHAHYWLGYYPNVTAIEEISVNSGKLALTGFGHADKDQMIASAARQGYAGMDEHQADALGIWMVFQFGKPETKAERLKRLRQEARGRSIL